MRSREDSNIKSSNSDCFLDAFSFGNGKDHLRTVKQLSWLADLPGCPTDTPEVSIIYLFWNQPGFLTPVLYIAVDPKGSAAGPARCLLLLSGGGQAGEEPPNTALCHTQVSVCNRNSVQSDGNSALLLLHMQQNNIWINLHVSAKHCQGGVSVVLERDVRICAEPRACWNPSVGFPGPPTAGARFL